VYGWQLHLVTPVAGVWIPLAADLTAANVADNEQALTLLPELPAEVRYVLGDQHYHDPAIDAACARAGQIVVATRRGPYPHTDAGVGVRRILHELRSRAIEIPKMIYDEGEEFPALFSCDKKHPHRK
jgi:hypothetical protein